MGRTWEQTSLQVASIATWVQARVPRERVRSSSLDLQRFRGPKRRGFIHEHSLCLEWRGSWREPPVVGVGFVARGDSDQGRLCEGPAHELEADREAMGTEPSRYNHGGKAAIRG